MGFLKKYASSTYSKFSTIRDFSCRYFCSCGHFCNKCCIWVTIVRTCSNYFHGGPGIDGVNLKHEILFVSFFWKYQIKPTTKFFDKFESKNNHCYHKFSKNSNLEKQNSLFINTIQSIHSPLQKGFALPYSRATTAYHIF